MIKNLCNVIRSLSGKKLFVVYFWTVGIIFLPKIKWLIVKVPLFSILFTVVCCVYMISQAVADSGSKGMTSFQNRR